MYVLAINPSNSYGKPIGICWKSFLKTQNNEFVPNTVKKQEVERLLQLYKEFTKNQNIETKRGKTGIDRTRFRDVLFQHFNMTDDILMDKGKLWQNVILYSLESELIWYNIKLEIAT